MGKYFSKTIERNYLDEVDKKLQGVRPSYVIGGTIASCVAFHYARKACLFVKEHPQGMVGAVVDTVYPWVEAAPGLSSKIDEETNKLKKDIDKVYDFRQGRIEPQFNDLPDDGLTFDNILGMLRKFRKVDECSTQKTSGAVYVGDANHVKLTNIAYSLFSHVNPLHVDYYKACCRMEREIIRMTVNLLHGNEKCVGLLTTGGTESIILAVKAARDHCRKKKPWIRKPEIIVCDTTHPGFDKACHYLCVKLVRVPADPQTHKSMVRKMEAAINKNTILLVGSAPSYPCGIIDPIDQIGALGQKYDILVHVDSCLGGWYLPFAQRLKLDIPNFDFLVPGVTSISADTHKFGLAPKGTSVVCFRTVQLRNCAFYANQKWCGGHYTTPTILGSRSGGIIAGTWTALVHMGMSGYKKVTMEIHKTVQTILSGIDTIPEVCVLGDPKAMVIGIGVDGNSPVKVNIYQIMDEMTKNGWKLNGIQHPKGFHFTVTQKNIGVGEQFIAALKDAVEVVKENPLIHKEDSAMIYGMAAIAPKKLVDGLGVYVIQKCLDGPENRE